MPPCVNSFLTVYGRDSFEKNMRRHQTCFGVLRLLTLLLFTLLAAPVSAQNLDMRQAVLYALKNNPGLDSKLKALEKAKMDIGTAQSFFWPRVSVSTSSDYLRNTGEYATVDDLSSRTNRQGYRISYTLFNGFAHLSNLQKSMISAEIAELTHLQTKMELIASIQSQFIDLLKYREEMRHIRDSFRRLETQLKAAKAFVAVGMAPQLNVLQNEVALARVRQEEIRLQNAMRSCEIRLGQYLGLAPDATVRYIGELGAYGRGTGYTEIEAVKIALKSRPDLLIADKSIEAAAKDSHAAAGNYLPKVEVAYSNMAMDRDFIDRRFVDYSRNYWQISLNFTWDIFSGGHTTFSYLAERKRMAALRKAYEDTLNAARTDVITSWMEMATCEELIKASRTNVTAAKESYAMANKRYVTGIGTITELLDAQEQLTKAEIDASRAVAEYQAARVKFFFYIGMENTPLR
jgi:outer membrane protein TolC